MQTAMVGEQAEYRPAAVAGVATRAAGLRGVPECLPGRGGVSQSRRGPGRVAGSPPGERGKRQGVRGRPAGCGPGKGGLPPQVVAVQAVEGGQAGQVDATVSNWAGGTV